MFGFLFLAPYARTTRYEEAFFPWKTKERMAPSRASLKLEVRAIEVSHAACKNDFRRNQLPGISQRTFYLFCAVDV